MEYAPGRGVSGVDLKVLGGECVAVLGRNGSGKSTLVQLVLGLKRVSSGSLFVLDRANHEGVGPPRRRMAAALDRSVHWENLSGWANAHFIARSYGLAPADARSRLEMLFRMADLWGDAAAAVETYSYGMRRKLGLIEALCVRPDLLVLDEPTIGVDLQFLVRLEEAIRELQNAGSAVFVASNDPDWISRVATRVVFMHDGRLIASGTVPELLAEVSPFQEIVATFQEALKCEAPPLEGLRSFDLSGNRLNAITDPTPSMIPRLMEALVDAGAVITSLEVHRTTLRDAYLHRTGSSLNPGEG